MDILIQRIYEPQPLKGYRVLVDRLWPRGISKQKAALDEWCKDIAPSTALRQWFGHTPGKWVEFKRKYLAELGHSKAAAEHLLAEAMQSRKALILLYGSKSREYNHAMVLKDYLSALMEDEAPLECASPPCFAHELDQKTRGKK